MNQMPGLCLPASQPGFTPKQGQYLAFIHAYTLVLGRAPAEAWSRSELPSLASKTREHDEQRFRPYLLIPLTAHLAPLSSISFGGFPTVLPDVRNFVVAAHGWMTDQEFANFFAMAQAIPGPNMIPMMSFVGWELRRAARIPQSLRAGIGSPPNRRESR